MSDGVDKKRKLLNIFTYFPFSISIHKKTIFLFSIIEKTKDFNGSRRDAQMDIFAKFSRISILINYAHISLETSEKLLQDRKNTSFKSVTNK